MIMFEASPGVEVIVVATKQTKLTRERVAERVAKGLCLVSDAPAAEGRRGLSEKEYWKFRTALLALPKSKRAAFEGKLVQQGKLLPSRQGQQANSGRNVFRDVAESF